MEEEIKKKSEFDNALLVVQKQTEQQAQDFINKMHHQHEIERNQQLEELKKKEEAFKKLQEDFKKQQEEAAKVAAEREAIQKEKELKEQELIKQQGQQEELKKLREEFQKIQEATAAALAEKQRIEREAELKQQEIEEQKAIARKAQLEREKVELKLAEASKLVPPQEIHDNLHLSHPLTLESYVYKKGQWICDKCNERGKGQVYHCKICRFDLHPDCATQYIAWKERK